MRASNGIGDNLGCGQLHFQQPTSVGDYVRPVLKLTLGSHADLRQSKYTCIQSWASDAQNPEISMQNDKSQLLAYVWVSSRLQQ